MPEANLAERGKVYAFSDLGKSRTGRTYKVINHTTNEKKLELRKASPGIVKRAQRVAVSTFIS